MLKRFLAAVVVTTALTLPAHAGLVVFDPTNYTANLQQMLSNIEMTAHDVTMIANQLTQIQQMAKQIESGNFTNLSTVIGFIDQTVAVAQQADGIASNLNQLDSIYRSTYQSDWDATAAAGGAGAGSAPSSGTTITWNDGTTSIVNGDGTDQNGYQIRWSDGSNTYIREPTPATFEQQTHNAVRAALAVQASVQQATAAHRASLSGAMTASQAAVGVTSAVQASNAILGLLSNQLTAQTDILSSHARAVEADTAAHTAQQQMDEANYRHWMRTTPPPPVQHDAIDAQFYRVN